jgi:sarcosine oxidase delta subunit
MRDYIIEVKCPYCGERYLATFHNVGDCPNEDCTEDEEDETFTFLPLTDNDDDDDDDEEEDEEEDLDAFANLLDDDEMPMSE